MLEEQNLSRSGYFVVIGLLIVVVIVLAYKVGSYEDTASSLRIIKEFTETQNNELKEALEWHMQVVEYYKALIFSGFQMPEDGTIFLEKGTLIIPSQVETGQD